MRRRRWPSALRPTTRWAISAPPSPTLRSKSISATPRLSIRPADGAECLPRGAARGRGALTAYVSTQIVAAARARIASTLRMDPQRIHVVAPYIGGGFGSKLEVHAETILALLAARQLQQPVKVAMTRQQIFQLVGMRPASSQRVRLAAQTATGDWSPLPTRRRCH